MLRHCHCVVNKLFKVSIIHYTMFCLGEKEIVVTNRGDPLDLVCVSSTPKELRSSPNLSKCDMFHCLKKIPNAFQLHFIFTCVKINFKLGYYFHTGM